MFGDMWTEVTDYWWVERGGSMEADSGASLYLPEDNESTFI